MERAQALFGGMRAGVSDPLCLCLSCVKCHQNKSCLPRAPPEVLGVSLCQCGHVDPQFDRLQSDLMKMSAALPWVFVPITSVLIQGPTAP